MNNVGLLMDKHGQWRTLLLDAAADNCDKGRTLPDVLADLVQLQILYEIERTILNKSGHFLTYLRTWYLRTWYNCGGFFTRKS
jgi:hypothetical protein